MNEIQLNTDQDADFPNIPSKFNVVLELNLRDETGFSHVTLPIGLTIRSLDSLLVILKSDVLGGVIAELLTKDIITKDIFESNFKRCSASERQITIFTPDTWLNWTDEQIKKAEKDKNNE